MAVSISPENLKKYQQEKSAKQKKDPSLLEFGEMAAKHVAGNFAKGAAQGAINAAPSMYNLGARGVNAVAATDLKPFPYKADFVDPNAMGAESGEMLGSMFMPGVGLAGKIPGAAMQLAGRTPGYLSKILGGMTSGAAASGGAQATMNPEGDIDPYAMVLPALMGGATSSVMGAPGSAASGYLDRLKNMGKNNPGSVRTPQQVQQMAPSFPENSIDLPALAGDKLGSGVYSNVFGRMMGTGVRNAEQKAIGASEKAAKDVEMLMTGGKSTAQRQQALEKGVQRDSKKAHKEAKRIYAELDNAAKESNATSKPKELTKYLSEEFGTSPTSSNIKLGGRDVSIDLSNPRNSAAREFTENQSKDAILKTPEVAALLKDVTSSGTPISEMIKIYQTLGKKSRSAADDNMKRIYGEMQTAIEKDIESTLAGGKFKDISSLWKKAREHYREEVVPYRKKSMRAIDKGIADEASIPKKLSERQHGKVASNLHASEKKLLEREQFGSDITPQSIAKEYGAMQGSAKANRLISPETQGRLSSINQMESALGNARKNQSNTSGESAIKAALASPLNHGAQLAGMGALKLLTPWATLGAGAANLATVGISRAARSKELRDAYVSGRGVNEKNLSKEIFPIWMRALGAVAKQAPKIPANIHAEGARKRRENEDYN